MNKNEMKAMHLTSIEDLIEEDYGKVETPAREEFELNADAFILGDQLKAERIKAGITQQELAERIGTKKSYISRVENGHTDVQLSTLYKLFQGLGRKVSVVVL